MRISIAQINPVLADFKYNREKILSDIQKASNEGCDLVVFPECTLFGYHPFDLLERAKIVEQQEKEFQYYELLKVEGNRIGLYAEEDTEVIYVYTYVGGTGGDDPDFPRTGIESNNIVEMIAMVSLVALGTTIVLKKKFM